MRVLQIIARGIASSLTLVLPKPRDAAKNTPAATKEPLPAELAFLNDDPDMIEHRAVQSEIARLMLADEWVEIADRIAEWEAELVSTPGGLRYHEIAVETALSGLQSLVDDVEHQALVDLKQAEIELGHFIDTYDRAQDSHVLALLAARAHLVLGQACRADHWPDAIRRDAWRQMAHHYVLAGDILAPYDARALMSPLMAEAQYLQALGSPGGAHKVPDRFATWITLDPSNPAIYATHADWLAYPENAGDDTILDLANEALDRTEATIGLGGYALFFQPLLHVRENARDLFDPELYASAMLDLATLSATQAEVNRTADALAGEIAACGPAAPVALKDTLLMLIRNELTVLYPRLWTISEDAIRSLVDEAKDVVPDLNLGNISKAA